MTDEKETRKNLEHLIKKAKNHLISANRRQDWRDDLGIPYLEDIPKGVWDEYNPRVVAGLAQLLDYSTGPPDNYGFEEICYGGTEPPSVFQGFIEDVKSDIKDLGPMALLTLPFNIWDLVYFGGEEILMAPFAYAYRPISGFWPRNQRRFEENLREAYDRYKELMSRK